MGDDIFVVLDDLTRAADRFARTSGDVERCVSASVESPPGALGYAQVESAYAAFRAHWVRAEQEVAQTAARVAPGLHQTAATYGHVDEQTAARFNALLPPPLAPVP